MDDIITNTQTKTRTLIALFHGVSWAASSDWIQIGDGVTLARFQGSAPQQAYHELCETHFIDDGEPFGYEVYATVQSDKSDLLFSHGDPYSIVDWISNLLTICTGIPVGMCRVISPWLEHDRPTNTEMAYYTGGQTEFLAPDYALLDNDAIRNIGQIWDRSNSLWSRNRAFGRLVSALTFFYYAWRSQYIEQICLNLAVTLEILFSPHNRTEVSHQIAFNVAKFVSMTPGDRENTYRKIKKFYGYRSSIVHGGVPKDSKIIDPTVETFGLVAKILKQILLDESLVETFNNDSKRKAYFGNRLFAN